MPVQTLAWTAGACMHACVHVWTGEPGTASRPGFVVHTSMSHECVHTGTCPRPKHDSWMHERVGQVVVCARMPHDCLRKCMRARVRVCLSGLRASMHAAGRNSCQCANTCVDSGRVRACMRACVDRRARKSERARLCCAQSHVARSKHDSWMHKRGHRACTCTNATHIAVHDLRACKHAAMLESMPVCGHVGSELRACMHAQVHTHNACRHESVCTRGQAFTHIVG